MIHKYRMSGCNIAIDAASGAIHELDACAYDALDHYPEKGADETARILSGRYPADEIMSCISEIDELIENGTLYTAEPAPPVAGYGTPYAAEPAPPAAGYGKPYAAEPATPVASGRGEPVVKALCLHVAHDCNLRCAYCFAKEGGYRGERRLMPVETGFAAIDFLIDNSGNRKNLEIDFFGGEPLMNFEAVRKITAYCRARGRERGKRFRFTLTTNGTLLNDESIRFINENMDNVVLSLDGRKEVNDKMRVTRGGGGSYESALPKIRRLVDERNGERYFIRGTYTRNNLDFAEDVKHLAGLGFKKISVEPVVAPETEDFALKPSDAGALCAEYEKLAAHMLEELRSGGGFEFFHFNIDLEGGPCLKKRVTGCGAGSEYLAVAPDGRLYPCHQFVGMEAFRLGDVVNGVTNRALRETFMSSSLHSKAKCAACWAKYYCGGGCAANAYNMNGDINEPYEPGCALHRKRCECAIMLKAAGHSDKT